jgi:RNA polymerase sigma factor (sigma-70 family)
LTTSSNHIAIETDFINRCIAGDRKSQEDLYNHFAGKMYAVCLRYSKDTEEAQDILQDGFVKVFRNLEKFRNEGSFEGWLRRIFVNTAIEYYRKRNKLSSSISEQIENSIEDDSVTVFEKLAATDVIKIINELSPGYKAVFNMYVIEGYSHKEIGELLQISEGTSKSQLARAKGMLQKIIKEKYSHYLK